MNVGLVDQILHYCRKHALLFGRERVVVGVSGGPDSLCLLHILVQLRHQLQLSLTVAHLDHQLRPESQGDADFVQNLAARWQLTCIIQSRNIAQLAGQRKQSIEETARQVRYAFLWQTASQVQATKIAVGHNADDQVETVLMHFLRGSGLAGLRGMLPQINIEALRLHPQDTPVQSDGPAPQLIRPLLDISRSEIERYCRENNLTPRQDYTNQDTTYFRNRLRHQLLPQLETYNPNIRQVIRRTASVVAADTQLLSEQLNRAWQQVVKEETPEQITFHLQRWLHLPLGLKRSTLRRATQKLRRSLRDISFVHIEKAVEIVEGQQTGASATLPQGLALTISYQTFTLAATEALSQPSTFDFPHLPKGQPIPVNLEGVTPLPQTGWQLTANKVARQQVKAGAIKNVGRWEAYLDADMAGQQISLRTRRPGDKFCPFGMGGQSKKINEFMIDQKVPAAWRNHVPLLAGNNYILWVCGYRLDERAAIRPNTNAVLHLKFERS